MQIEDNNNQNWEWKMSDSKQTRFCSIFTAPTVAIHKCFISNKTSILLYISIAIIWSAL